MTVKRQHLDVTWLSERLRKSRSKYSHFPYTSDVDEILTISALCDGYLFTGGQDVSPELYHEKKQPYCGELSPTLDTLTKVVFEDAEFSDKAILGICRGCQILNVLFGGSLYQDLNIQYQSNNGKHIEHHQNKPYDNTSHKVTLNSDGYLHKLLKKMNCKSTACITKALKMLVLA